MAQGVWEDFQWRGLVHQVTDHELGKLLDHDFLTVYAGFDPTADSLHAGSLLPAFCLRRLQLAGHQPIALLGGGTGLIGDPSGRDEERLLLSEGELEANLAGIGRQLEHLLETDGASGTAARPALLLNNGDWLRQLRLTDFLRDVGKHFTVNEMIRKDSVRSRLEQREQGISYTEFSYMLLQAYDFVHLFDHHDCRLQVGGSDQWGNIVEGVDLIRRVRGEQAYGLTWPLLTTDEGAKLGKSEARTRVWLDARRTSPYQFFQYWLRTDDAQVGMRLRWFTFLAREEIEALDDETAERPERREAQRALARHVTALVHGDEEATKAERAATVLFSEEIAVLDEATLLDVVSDAPSTVLPRTRLVAGLSLVDALVESGLVPSKSAARKTIDQGGAYVNNRREDDVERRLEATDALHGRYVVLRKGKREQHLMKFE